METGSIPIFSDGSCKYHGSGHTYPNIAISGSGNVHLGDIYQQNWCDVTHKMQYAQNVEAAANWFSPDDFAIHHNELIERFQKGCGEWFLTHNQVCTWRDSDNTSLVCLGKPGCGKTMMMASLVQQLHQAYEQESAVATIYYYFLSTDRAEQNLRQVLAALLRQLFQERPSLPEAVKMTYTRHCTRRTRPSIDEMKDLLQSLIGQYRKVFVLLDALDECSNFDRGRDNLLQLVAELQDSKTGNICMLSTTREIPEILRHFPNSARLDVQGRDADIQCYLTARIPELAACVRRDNSLQNEIVSRITASVDGIFLLARIYFDGLRDQTTPKQIRDTLRSLRQGPVALQQAYEQARQRIDNQLFGHRCLAQKILTWLTLARCQLTLEELQEAIAVESGMRPADLRDNITDEDTIVSVCGGLIMISRGKRIVRFIHETVQQYFESICPGWTPDGQATITVTCLTYLSIHSIIPLPLHEGTIFAVDLDDLFIQCRFLQYAGQNWGFHLALTEDEHVHAQARALLNDKQRLAFASTIMLTEKTILGGFVCRTKNVSPLMVCVWFGLTDIAFSVLSSGACKTVQDSMGRDFLSWAAERGRGEIVKYAVRQPDVRAGMSDQMGRAPLSWAAKTGQIDIVKELLCCTDVEADIKDDHGRTPLSLAAQNGHADIVEVLLARDDVKVDAVDLCESTPLSWAIVCRHTAIVRLLLAHESGDAGLNTTDDEGRTPLSWAAEDGHTEIVELLLACANIEANKPDGDGQTPLSRAAKDGHTVVVELLLKRPDVRADTADEGNRTPLLWAARHGHADVVALLLLQDEVDWDTVDEDGCTPLSWAAQNGHEDVVLLILGRAALDAGMAWEESEKNEIAID